ncbi:hypothetical protein FVER53590_09814 [Fusarium verticillioides]|nr:hypothetical protein FVER53590_09814 [Fusarium verticillioides]
MTVEYECGFSIYPPLPPTPSNQSLYALFLARLRTTFSSQLHPFTSRLLLIADADAAFYYFTLPKFPKIPANHEHCNYFLSFRLSFGDGGLPREVTVAHVLEVLVIAKECFGESVRSMDFKVTAMETVVETLEESNVVEVGPLALLG